jgi:hypothetical protein
MKLNNIVIFTFSLLTINLQGQKLGIIVEDSVSVRSFSNSNSDIVYILRKYDFVRINAVSNIFEPENPPCDLCYYPWVKIEKSNKIGWVLGCDLYTPTFSSAAISKNNKFEKGFKFFDWNCKIGTLSTFQPTLDSGKSYDGFLPSFSIIMFYTDKFNQIFVIPHFDNSNGFLNLSSGSSIIDIISGEKSVLIKYNDFEGGESMLRQIILFKNSNNEIVYKELK